MDGKRWHRTSTIYTSLFLNLLGLDFSSSPKALSKEALSSGTVKPDDLFYALAGALHHALLEWSAVSIAVAAAVVSFAHYTQRGDVTVPIIGMALLCAGFVDAFHTLAATRIISANAPNPDFIPFTWALSRIFNASIMILGITISLWISKHTNSDKLNSLPVLLLVSVFFITLAYAVVALAANSDNLPKIMFPNAIVTRPYDVLPLALFIFGGTLIWTWYKHNTTLVKYALLLSLLPETTTQLHMAFGSTALFDNDFNIAHALKIVAYGSILSGLLFDLLQHTTPLASQTNTTIPENRKPIKSLLPASKATRPQTIVLPAAAFSLALLVSILVGFSFYIESERLITDQQTNRLKLESTLVKPLLSDLYNRSTNDVLFLSHTRPIQEIIKAINKKDQHNYSLWQHRLEQIFSRVLDNNSSYLQIRYISISEKGQELVNVIRNTINSQPIASSNPKLIDVSSYISSTIQQSAGNVNFSNIQLKRENKQIVTPHISELLVATPIHQQDSNEPFGIIIINTDFGKFMSELKQHYFTNINIYLANQNGDFIYHPDPSKRFGFEFGKAWLMQDMFPELNSIIANNEVQKTFTSYTSNNSDKNGVKDSVTGYYSLVRFSNNKKQPPLRQLLIYNENSSLERLQYFRDRSLLLGLALSLVALALLVLASQRIALSLAQIKRTMEDYKGTGTSLSLPTDSRDEIGVLARNFHNMLIIKQKRDRELAEQKFALDQHAIVTITDTQRIITFANERFTEISHFRVEELVGRNHRILNSSHHDSSFWKEMYLSISNGNVWQAEVRNHTKDADTYWVETTIVPFTTDDGSPQNYISIQTDITKRKKSELALIQSKKVAEEAALAKSGFLASMSHEIRTPINGELGMIGLLLNSDLNSNQQHKAKLVQLNAKSLLTLINDILDFSKVDAGKLELEMMDFDLRSQLDELVESMAHRAQEKGLEIVLDTTGVEQSLVIGDPGRLQQIFTNLVGSAIKFTQEGGVVIRAALKELDENNLIFYGSVSDTGIGIPDHKISTLFDSFTQADTSTTRKYGGTGLGLAIAKKLCWLMGGSISAQSELGKGSLFERTLPLKCSKNSKRVVPQIKTDELHLLVVDDNATNRDALRGQLEHWGSQVSEARDGLSALELCRLRAESTSKMFDVAFLDMQIPGMDGTELYSLFRKDHRFDSMKLIMMTSISQPGDEQHFAKLGYSVYFPKPATTENLFLALPIAVKNGKTIEITNSLVTPHYVKNLAYNPPTTFQSDTWPTGTSILLVEDNHINQEVALGLLDAMGLNADSVPNGQEAITILKQTPEDARYTLVLMDCQMPIMDGFTASQNIRAGNASEYNQNIPIIAMTANAMKRDSEACLDAGMDDYLSKSIDLETLNIALRKWLPDTKTTSTELEEPPCKTSSPTSLSRSEWDKQKTLKRMGGKETLLFKIARLYLEETPTEIETLEIAIATQNIEKIGGQAHKIKGIAANMGGLTLSSIAEKMENFAKTNGHESQLRTLSIELRNAHEQFSRCLQQYVKQFQSETPPGHSE
ncbi:MAG: response regulator [Flavobacteriales bacterium]|nr:response regulator [Flavobacteriales bacterium]